jgi:hypothetical protein
VFEKLRSPTLFLSLLSLLSSYPEKRKKHLYNISFLSAFCSFTSCLDTWLQGETNLITLHGQMRREFESSCCGDISHKQRDKKGKEKEKKQVVLLWNRVKSRKNTKQQEIGRRREGMGLKSLGCIPSVKTFHSRYAVVFTTA